jgi:hypothetical protein
MSMTEDPFDDGFEEFFNSQFEEPDLSDAENYKEMPSFEILDLFTDVREELLNMGEMMEPKTDKGLSLIHI